LYTSKTSSEITDSQHKAQRISDLHAQFSSQATGISPLEAEEQFIKLAQTEASYGAHYYRVYKIKPSKKNENFNRYSETHLLKIMPFGIGISREKLATQNTDSIYEWFVLFYY
jgi:hypothetical protein